MEKEIKNFQGYLLNNNLSNNSIEAYSKDIILLNDYLKENNLTLKNATNQNLIDYLNLKPLKTTSYNRKVTSIIEFYKFLNIKNIKNNIDLNQIEHIKNDKVYPKIIKYNDILNILKTFNDDVIGNRNKAIILLLYISGLRVSELLNLKYGDINMDEGYIRCIGKGNKEKIIYVGDALKVCLVKYNEYRKQILNGLISDYIFLNNEGEKLSRQLIYDIVKKAAKEANIKLNVTPHTLRHCFATHMIENGADIRSVQEMLGHASIATTQVYLNISSSTIKNTYMEHFNDPLNYLKEEKKNMKFKRAFVIVCDSMGIGHASDAKMYNDEGSNTLKHIDDKVKLNIPELRSLGIGNIDDIKKEDVKLDHSYALAMSEASVGKDTLTGHYELMGLKVTTPFKTFTDTGFPQELMDELEKRWNRKIIGNKAASGTEIIKELGEEHMKTGAVIVYTSSDSVLQIAAHEDIISVPELYKMCEIAREITKDDKYKLGRIIARPFIGTCAADFKRTPRRHDYALKPFAKTLLNNLKDANYDVISIGKIVDIFDGEGITDFTKTVSNDDGCQKIIERMKQDFNGLCFANLVDFDMEYGHRRNVIGYGKAIEDFDKYLKEFKELLNEDDILFITADHGNDPTWIGSDHTREKVPLLIYSKSFKETGTLPEANTFAALSATLADIFNVPKTSLGESFLDKLK